MAAISTYLAIAGAGLAADSHIKGNIARDESTREQAYQQQAIAAQRESELTKRKGLIDSQRRQLLGKGDAPLYRLGTTGSTGVKAPAGMGAADTLTGVTLG